jgi:hypothetical protein
MSFLNWNMEKKPPEDTLKPVASVLLRCYPGHTTVLPTPLSIVTMHI